jgi:hypothetical protein
MVNQLVCRSDAGRTVYASNPTLNALMATAGEQLNLRAHRVGHQEISGPGDIEGHLGEVWY